METHRSSKPTPHWPLLTLGMAMTVVKLAPDGREATRYPGTVIDAGAPAPWVAVEATWITRVVELDGLTFVPGDTLHEFFSPEHAYNLFSVFAPDGRLRGWYANVTYPTVLRTDLDRPALFWHDLYLDVVALPDGHVVVRDEDELEESGLATENPPLHAAILDARDELLLLFATRAFPFHERTHDG